MNDEPQHPSHEALRAYFAQVCDSLVAADSCHRAKVVIMEGLQVLVVVRKLDEVFCQLGSLLDRHLRQLRMAFGIGRVSSHQTLVTNGKDIFHAPYTVAAVDENAETAPEHIALDACDRLGTDTGHPEEGTRGNRCAVFDDDAIVAVVGHHLAELYVDPHALQIFECLLRGFLRHTS